ncbi:NAD(P)H-binding protein [Actinoplanes sp. NPDC004185]
MIIVTGASGQLGRAVLDNLLEHVPAEQLGASVRDPQQLTDLHQRGVRVRPGDFDDPAGLGDAFEGASTVLIVSVNSTGAESVRRHRNAVNAAVAAGVKRIVYTSHMGADPASPFPPMPDHAATEDALRQAGVAFTALRNGFYASTVPMLLGHALQTGELRVPEDGPVAWTTHADLAAAAAKILIDGGFDGLTPPLTGPAAVDMTRVAEIATQRTGRPIHRVVVPDEEYRQGLLAAGLPESAADMLVGLFAASRRGDFAPAGPTLAGLLGRPATSIEDYLVSSLPAGPER